MSGDMTRNGGCLCGQVRYTAPAKPLAVVVCHCRDCQKQSGSALSLIAVFPRGELEFAGDIACYEGHGESGKAVLRHFCAHCGSPIYSDNELMQTRGILAVKAGTLDEVTDLAPQRHVWTASKQPWFDAGDVPCIERE